MSSAQPLNQETELRPEERRQWFRLEHPVPIRWLPIDSDQVPRMAELEQGLPQAMRLANEIRSQLGAIRHSHRKLWQATEQKLDALLSVLLSQDPGRGRAGTLLEISAGGGKLRIPSSLTGTKHLQLLLLPPEPGYPMVVTAEVIRRSVDEDMCELALQWSRIRPQDQDNLVRCTLAWQAQQLRYR